MNGLEYQIPKELVVEDLGVLKDIDVKIYEQWTLDKLMGHYQEEKPVNIEVRPKRKPLYDEVREYKK